MSATGRDAAPPSATSPTTTTLDQLFTSRVATLVPEAVEATVAAAVRQRLERAGYARYALLDRGSYEFCDAPAEPELCAALLAAAGKATGRALALASVRALRLLPGDYLLAHHDRVDEPDERDGGDGLVELTLDLSPTAVPGAEVHYRRNGRPFFQLPSAPRTLAIVERDAGVRCNHSYLSKRLPQTQVVRLVLRLRPA